MYNEIDKIETLMADGNYEGALQRSHKVMGMLGSYTEAQLSSKMAFTARVNSIMGNTYLELNDYNNAERHHSMDLSIGEEYCIDEAELRALDNLGRVHARHGNFQKAIEVWERKLPMSKGELEIAWLCHELGRCYLELDSTSVAKEYGMRSLAAAEEAKDDRWQLHAYVLISQADVKSGRLSSALINFEKAAELATLLMDLEAKAAILTAMEDANMKIMEREKDPGIDPLKGLKLDSDEDKVSEYLEFGISCSLYVVLISAARSAFCDLSDTVVEN